MILHIDTANQIDNSWYKDTATGVYAEDSSFSSSIMIKHSWKLKIKDKLIKTYSESDIAGYLQAYLVFLCLKEKENILYNSSVKRTWLCPDVKPPKHYMKCLQKCFSNHGKNQLFLSLKIKPKEAKEKSKAHPKISKIYKGKRKPAYNFSKKDMGGFIRFFNRLSLKKRE